MLMRDEKEVQNIGQLFRPAQVNVYAEAGVRGFEYIPHIVQVPYCQPLLYLGSMNVCQRPAGGLSQVVEPGMSFFCEISRAVVCVPALNIIKIVGGCELIAGTLQDSHSFPALRPVLSVGRIFPKPLADFFQPLTARFEFQTVLCGHWFLPARHQNSAEPKAEK